MIREIDASIITDAVERLVMKAGTVLPTDVCKLIRDALPREESETGRAILEDITENIEIAERRALPICQDTGMAVLFCEVGSDVHINGCYEDAVNEGVRRGYKNGGLRMSVVSDPIRRVNTDDNTPAVIHTRIVPGNRIRIIFCPKGFGSENASAVKMFNPTSSVAEMEDFIASVAINAGANPCPPVILGVGLGGTLDSAAVAAKYALAGGVREKDELYDGMEQNILDKINRSGVGPMGLGGRVTALKVSILPLPTHIAGLPCVVNVCCHVARHAEETI